MKENLTDFPKGLRKTKPRMEILELFQKENRPLSANDIRFLLEDSLWLSTIYRVLDDFHHRQMITKIDFPNHDTSMYQWGTAHHQHFAICKTCKRTTPLDGCPFDGFTSNLDAKGFSVEEHEVQIYGLCKSCQNS